MRRAYTIGAPSIFVNKNGLAQYPEFRDQGVGGSNPLSPSNSKGLIGTHSGRNWAQLRESEAQSYPLRGHCTKHPVYLYPGTSVALSDVLVRVSHPNVNEDLRHQLFIEVSRPESPEAM